MASTNMYVGQSTIMTPTVTGSDSAQAPGQGFTLSYVLGGTAGVIQVTILPLSGSGVGSQPQALIVAIGAGTATVTWTFTPNPSDGYTGAAVSASADTFTVSAKRTLSSGTTTYSTPA